MIAGGFSMQHLHERISAVSMSSASHEECIAHCLEAFRACSELIPHELNLHGDISASAHIRLLSGCSLMCETAAKMLMLDSELQAKVCALCAEICLQTAQSCEDHAEENRFALECARACRRCAKSCQDVAPL